MWLLRPGVPFYILSFAGVLLAVLGVLQLESARMALAGVRSVPSRWGMRGRYTIGQIAAIPIAGTLLLIGRFGGSSGMLQLLIYVIAVGFYLYVGVALPRRPLYQAEKERRRLRALTPSLISYIRIASAAHDPPAEILTRYIKRPNPRIAPMQQLVGEAVDLMLGEQRLRPYEALRRVARARGCQELTDVAEALANQTHGANPEQVLAAHETTLQIILRDEFRRMLRRRAAYLMGLAAIAIVISIVGDILFIFAGPLVFGTGG